MDMNLLKYRAFVATVEDGSFTRAAERLHYSQSGLEREWNLTLLEKGAKAEIAALFERYHLQPNVHFTTWDDYAVMSMVESGLGISILPELILKRVPYRIAIRELDVPALRTIAFCLRDRKNASLAGKRFLEYLDFREEKTAQPCGKTRES